MPILTLSRQVLKLDYRVENGKANYSEDLLCLFDYDKILSSLDIISATLKPIPANLTFGDPCGPCKCPPHFTMGECAEGLICEHNILFVDAPGSCVWQNTSKQEI